MMKVFFTGKKQGGWQFDKGESKLISDNLLVYVISEGLVYKAIHVKSHNEIELEYELKDETNQIKLLQQLERNGSRFRNIVGQLEKLYEENKSCMYLLKDKLYSVEIIRHKRNEDKIDIKVARGKDALIKLLVPIFKERYANDISIMIRDADTREDITCNQIVRSILSQCKGLARAQVIKELNEVV